MGPNIKDKKKKENVNGEKTQKENEGFFVKLLSKQAIKMIFKSFIHNILLREQSGNKIGISVLQRNIQEKVWK